LKSVGGLERFVTDEPTTNWSPVPLASSAPSDITCSTGTLKKVQPTSDLNYAPFYYCASNNKIYDITCPSSVLLNNKYCYDEGLSNDDYIDDSCMYDSNSSNQFDNDIGYLYLCEDNDGSPEGGGDEEAGGVGGSPPPPSGPIKIEEKIRRPNSWIGPNIIDSSSSSLTNPNDVSCPDGSDLKAYKNDSKNSQNQKIYPYFWFCESNQHLLPISNCPVDQTSRTKSSDTTVTIPAKLSNIALLCHDRHMSSDPNKAGCSHVMNDLDTSGSYYAKDYPSYIIQSQSEYKLKNDFPFVCTQGVHAD
jgi:hypothetical protein